MSRETIISGTAALVDFPDIDTDVLIPVEYCLDLERPHFDVALFRKWRFHEDDSEIEEFVLNQSEYRDARILVAGPNFGCGSSREMAVWALHDFGIRCVIAPSFGDIFYNNCFNNGLLAAPVTDAGYARLCELLRENKPQVLSADVSAKQVQLPNGELLDFEIDDLRREMFVEGLDPIAATLTFAEDIARFEQRQATEWPWAQRLTSMR
ncbi:MAG: 3-isopropylmalate dehydratase small subunit [Pseudomonadota bacterium]